MDSLSGGGEGFSGRKWKRRRGSGALIRIGDEWVLVGEPAGDYMWSMKSLTSL